ncbi:hypothetical protein D9M68_223540 [compost metagenome]
MFDLSQAFPALNTIARLPDMAHFGSNGAPLPPLPALYERSLNKVLVRFSELQDLLPHNFIATFYQERWEDISNGLESLMLAIESYEDDCVTIARAVERASGKQLGKKPVSSALFKEFFDRVVSCPINQIKHHGASLAPVIYERNGLTVVAYIVVGYHDHGVLGPSLLVHRDGKPFSFGVKLREMLYGVSRASHVLHQSLLKMDMVKDAPKSVGQLVARAPVDRIAAWFTESPRFHTPGEDPHLVRDVRMQFDKLHVAPKAMHRFRNIEMPGTKTSVTFVADGYTRTFKAPMPLSGNVALPGK